MKRLTIILTEQERTAREISNMCFRDFDIIWVEQRSYPKEMPIHSHRHDFFHYIYVDSGEGRITVGSEEYKLASGCVYAVPPNTDHGFYNSEDVLLVTYEIKFYLGENEEKCTSLLFPYCIQVQSLPIKECITRIYTESHEGGPLSEEIVSLNFGLLMTYLLRCCRGLIDDVKKESKRITSKELEKVLKYISDNLGEELTLEGLADIAGFDKNYFLRKFKKQIGTTPMVYILSRRIERAKSLLRFSDLNITQIAITTGFKSVHYFSRVFFKYVKVRPSDYRKR